MIGTVIAIEIISAVVIIITIIIGDELKVARTDRLEKNGSDGGGRNQPAHVHLTARDRADAGMCSSINLDVTKVQLFMDHHSPHLRLHIDIQQTAKTMTETDRQI